VDWDCGKRVEGRGRLLSDCGFSDCGFAFFVDPRFLCVGFFSVVGDRFFIFVGSLSALGRKGSGTGR
jgi:hypothetical protein